MDLKRKSTDKIYEKLLILILFLCLPKLYMMFPTTLSVNKKSVSNHEYFTLSLKYNTNNGDLRMYDDEHRVIPPYYGGCCTICHYKYQECTCDLTGMNLTWVSRTSLVNWDRLNEGQKKKTIMYRSNVVTILDRYLVHILRTVDDSFIICPNVHDFVDSDAFKKHFNLPPTFSCFKIPMNTFSLDRIVEQFSNKEYFLMKPTWNCDLVDCNEEDVFKFMNNGLGIKGPVIIKSQPPEPIYNNYLYTEVMKNASLDDGIAKDLPRDVFDFLAERKHVNPPYFPEYIARFVNIDIDTAIKALFFTHIPRHHDKGFFFVLPTKHIGIRYNITTIGDFNGTVDDMYSALLQKHYDANPHHPENKDFPAIENSIECLIDLWVSAMRITDDPFHAISVFRSWMLDIVKNEYGVYLSVKIKPKFAKIHPVAILLFMKKLVSTGIYAGKRPEFLISAKRRTEPLSCEGDEALKNPQKVLNLPPSDRLSALLKIPECINNLEDTRLHIRGVNSILSQFCMAAKHDADKMNFDMFFIYSLRWNCYTPKGVPKILPSPTFCSDIPDFSTTSSKPSDFFSSMGNKWKKSFSLFVKDDILDGIIDQAKTTLKYVMDIAGSFAGLMDKFKKFFNPILNYFNFSLSSTDIDNNTIFSLLGCWLAWMNSTSTLVRGATIILAMKVLGIYDKGVDAISSICKMAGFSFRAPAKDQPIFCSNTIGSLSDFFEKIFDPDNAQYGGWLVGLLVALICGYKSFDAKFVKEQGGSVVSVFKNLHFIGAGMFGVSRICSWVTAGLQVAFRFIRKNLLGKEPTDEIKKRKSREFQEKVAVWSGLVRAIAVEATSKILPRSPKIRETVKQLYNEGVSYNVQILSELDVDPKQQIYPTAFRNEVSDRLRDLKPFFESVARIEVIGTARAVPFHIQFVGRPGVGKSYLHHALEREIARKYYPNEDVDHISYCDPGPSVEYKNGYSENHRIYRFDEAWAIDKAESVVQFLVMMSNAPLNMPMARLEDKNTMFKSDWIISNTNTPYPNVTGMYSPEALYRRRDLLVEVTIKKNVINTEGAFDPVKFAQFYPNDDSVSFPHLTFNLINPMKPGEAQQTAYETELENSGVKAPMTGLNWNDFLERVFQRRDITRKAQHDKFDVADRPEKYIQETLNEINATVMNPSGRLFNLNFEHKFKICDDDLDFDCEDIHDMKDEFAEVMGSLRNNAEDFPDKMESYLVKYKNSKVLAETFIMDIRDLDAMAVNLLDKKNSGRWFYYWWILHMLKTYTGRSADIVYFNEIIQTGTWQDLCLFRDLDWIKKLTGHSRFFHDVLTPVTELVAKLDNNKKEKKKITITDVDFYAAKVCIHISALIRRNHVGYGGLPSDDVCDRITDMTFCSNFSWNNDTFYDDYNCLDDWLDAIGKCAQLTTEDHDERDRKLGILVQSFYDKYIVRDTPDITKSALIGMGSTLWEVFCYNKAESNHDFCYALRLVFQRIALEHTEPFLKSILLNRPNSRYATPFTTIGALVLNTEDPYPVRYANTQDFYRREAVGKAGKDHLAEYRVGFNFHNLAPPQYHLGDLVKQITRGGVSETAYIIPPNVKVLGRSATPLDTYMSRFKMTMPASLSGGLGGIPGREETFGMDFLIGLGKDFDGRGKSFFYYDPVIFREYSRTDPILPRIAVTPVAGDIERFSTLPNGIREYFYMESKRRRQIFDFLIGMRIRARELIARFKSTVISAYRCSKNYLFNHFSEFKKVYISSIIAASMAYGLTKIFEMFKPPEFKSSQPVKSVPPSKHMPTFCNSLTTDFMTATSKYFIYCSIDGASFHGIRLTGKYIMVPLHVVNHLIGSKIKEYEFCYRPSGRSTAMWKINAQVQYIRKIPNCDAAIIWCRELPAVSSCLNKFWSNKTFDNHSLPTTLGCSYYDTQNPNSLSLHTSTIIPRVQKACKIPGLDPGVQYTTIHCEGNFPRGSSGTPVVGLNPHVPNNECILGVVSCQWSNNAVVSVTPRETIESVLNEMSSGVYDIADIGPAFCSGLGTPTKAVDFVEHVEIIGGVDHNMRMFSSGKTAFQPTPIAEYLPPSSVKPAILSPTPTVPSPLKHSINKFGRDTMTPLRTDILAEAATGIRSYLEDVLRRARPGRACHLRMLSFEEAVFGDGTGRYRPLDWTTSPGLPFVALSEKNKPGKKFFFDPDTKFVHPLIKESHAEIFDNAAGGYISEHLMYDFMKDELRPIAKVDEGKTRSICVNSVTWGILYRQLFGDLESVLRQASDGSMMYLPGCDIFSLEGFNLFLTVFAGRPNCVCLDVGNWDGHMTPQLFNAVTDVINLLYDRFEHNSDSTRIRNMRMREVVGNQALFGYVLYQDTIYRKWRGLPSGFAGTTFYNTIAHMILFYYFYLEIHMQHTRVSDCNLLTYLNRVQVRFCGDDVYAGISDAGFDIYNGMTIAAKYEQYGWPATDSGAKTCAVRKTVPISESVVLKASPMPFIYRDGMILYCLDPEVCWNMVKWYRKTDQGLQQFYQNFLIGLLHMCRRGPDAYNEYLDSVNSALNTVRMAPVNLTYPQARRIVQEQLLKNFAQSTNLPVDQPIDPDWTDVAEQQMSEKIHEMRVSTGGGYHSAYNELTNIVDSERSEAAKHVTSRIPHPTHTNRILDIIANTVPPVFHAPPIFVDPDFDL